ncbi:ead/Ea22-like family protein [Salmonella enterica]
MTNKQALREVAERATKGEWSVQFGDEIYSTDGVENQQIAMVFSINDESDAEFIAAANPATMLALLDENLQLQRGKDALEAVALELRDDMRQAREQLEAAERRTANNERVMRAVVEAASIRGIRPFEGIECDPPTLEENAEACGDAMSARIRELEANPPKPHHNGLMQISNELVQARQRIAELEARQGKPVMFIDGDISSADAEKLAAVIREFNEETETPAARMARIIRDNPNPTNMCDMPTAGIGVKGERDG